MRTTAVAAGAIVAWLAAVVALTSIGWPADRYRHNDFAGFWAGARVLIEGGDPYDLPTWLAIHERIGSEGRALVPRGTAFGYPLTTAVVFAPLGLLPVALAAPVWLVTQVAAALAAVVALGRHLLRPETSRDLPLVVAFGASSQPAWVLVEGGNLGGLLLAIVAGALALLLRGHAVLGGAVLGLLVVKPHPFLLFVPLLLLALPRRAAVRALAAAAAVGGGILVLSLLLRPDWIAEWLVPVGRIQAAPVGRATAYGLAPPDARWLGLLLVAALLAVMWVWWRSTRPAMPVVAGAALAVSLVAAPYGWSYDQLVLAVAVAVAVALAGPLPPASRVRALALVALVSVALPWILYVRAFTSGHEAWSVLSPIATFATLLLIHRELRRHRAAQHYAAADA